MTRDEYKAARERYREQWSAEARRHHALAMRNLRRFAWFVGGMFVLACVAGAVMH